ncbi:hypothetical protein FSP39_010955 [Pinctada imbricata]|uniref:Phenylalanine ammonia-lyase n=1 Tax=Pinctada imbricata TaxID=66713 RepID=A0AA89BKJ0_PINIB|nr:hypothetical protein FSP39_010955 [Pinctada imbricata]
MATSQLKITLDYIKQRKKASSTLELNGTNLKIPYVVACSQQRNIKVSLSASTEKDLTDNVAFLEDELRKGKIIYGVNTGFGASANVRTWKLENLQHSLIRVLTAGMGKEFSPDKVRAAMLIRANCLAKAYSGVRPVVIKSLLNMINCDITPTVPLRGSISSSGDLMPLGYIAAALIGFESSQATKNGKRTSSREAFEEAGLDHLVLRPKEGLALTNATSFSAGHASHVLYDANILMLLTQICTALSVEVLKGSMESFHPLLNQCLPHKGPTEVAENLMFLLDGSKLATDTLSMHLPDEYGKLQQDRYSLRTSPQWLGPVVETLNESCRRITIELNSANDNPIIDHRKKMIVNGGNFQGETMSVAMDQTRQGLGICGKLLFAQFSEIVNSSLNFGLTPNLCGSDVNLDFGFKGCDIAMASYMAELDHYVNPMSNHILSAEMHNQSINSMALVSSRLTAEVIEILQMMVTNSILLTVQGVDMRYLRSLVINEMEMFTKENPEIEDIFNDVEWYDLVFADEDTMKERIKGLACRMEGEHTKVQDLLFRLKKMYQAVCDGSAETCKMLGKGVILYYITIYAHDQC